MVAPSAQSVVIGSGSCTSNSSTSSVVVALSGGNCFVAVYATGANTWTPPAGVSTIDFLLIAGGGAGGSGAWGGGGGAGEVVSRTNFSVTGGSAVSFSIGTGGTPGTATLTASLNRSNNGGNSWVGSASGVVANGGGAGASYAYDTGDSTYAVGSNGGSGGGATEFPTVQNGGSSTASSSANRVGYGNAGGRGGPGGGTQSGGGGGGAGGAGTNAGTGTGGNGGSGTNAFSSWLSAISSGMSVVTNWQSATASGFIAGGGGGGTTTTAGTAGAGGGAAGGSNSTSFNGGAAVANTGSGGGGTGYGGSSRTGGMGGSGLLIIRYASDTTAPTFTNSTTFSIAENTATSTNAATISVNESSTITITSGTDSARFTLVTSDSVTARIRFVAIPNFEAPLDVGTNNVYDISVRATDTAGNIANQSISITVTNVNEAPTITINSSNETHAITQAENISSVVTYTGTDVDAATTLSWSLSGTDAADFSINSSSGALAFSSNPDFEAPADSGANNVYDIIITVSDGSLTDTQTVTITITNANESASINAPTVSGVVFKGVIETITVTINVAGKVRFFVGGKRISTCKDRTTSGTYPNNSATCSWRPAVTGRQILTATLTPTDNTFSASTSAPTTVQVVRRGTTR